MKFINLFFIFFILSSGLYAQNIQITSVQKISNSYGNLGNDINSQDHFGHWFNLIGDLNNDGFMDMVVGCDTDDEDGTDKGSIYIVLLDSNQKVKSKQKISESNGLNTTMPNAAHFGFSTASIGDLDDDGVNDLIIGSVGEDNFKGAVYIVFLNSNSTVKNTKRIASQTSGFNTTLNNSDLFGVSVQGLGDYDGDGIEDVAVGSCNDDDGGTDRGAVWIFSLNKNGTVKSYHKISSIAGSFNGSLTDGNKFGVGLANIGDIDNDGNNDIAVGTTLDDDGGTDVGCVWILFMDNSGNVKDEQKISATQGNFTANLGNYNAFGVSIAPAGDLNNDSIPDIIVGCNGDDESGINQGAFFVINLNSDGTVKAYKKINNGITNFSGFIDDNDGFGVHTAIADVNNDGFLDLLASSDMDDDGQTDAGAIYILTTNISAKTVTSTFEKVENSINYSVYPNPFQDVVNIKFNDFITPISYEIISPDGKIIQRQLLNNSKTQELHINLNHVNSGIQYLKIYAKEGVIISKLTKLND